MFDEKVTVLEAKDETIYTKPAGKLEKVTRVKFMIGELGPFVEDFPEGTFSTDALRAAVQKRVDALRPFSL